jgi:hypothetical protein
MAGDAPVHRTTSAGGGSPAARPIPDDLWSLQVGEGAGSAEPDVHCVLPGERQHHCNLQMRNLIAWNIAQEPERQVHRFRFHPAHWRLIALKTRLQICQFLAGACQAVQQQ